MEEFEEKYNRFLGCYIKSLDVLIDEMLVDSTLTDVEKAVFLERFKIEFNNFMYNKINDRYQD